MITFSFLGHAKDLEEAENIGFALINCDIINLCSPPNSLSPARGMDTCMKML